MDQIEIGKFIAKERKLKRYTQKQLSEILGISDKTVSKWECGKGFPEVSLLLPLCNELDITVNELLSGKRLSEDSYKRKAEENIMGLISEKEVNKKRWRAMILLGAISMLSYVTFLIILICYKDAMSTSSKVTIGIIAGTIFAVGFYSIMQGQRTIGYYKCPACNEVFIPSVKNHIFGINIWSIRSLKCPHCHKIKFCKKVMSKDE